ncbi:hypothetical protein [Methylobacterium brachiatum]|uniref:hypothetical protein n=1 Tax=Methylobacterium brachiatum TaxID=269660 RepID=UPI0008EA0593|nr:hypothetical protein [Methylobacterium brachiatum]SFI05238.1 hypothetical protein SAMN02799642_00547 [Methylobacterium brachiatum]
MNGLPDQPWHAEAIRLHGLGWTTERIAFEVGRSTFTVQKLLFPGTQRGIRKRSRERQRRRALDPAYAERERARFRARHAHQKETRHDRS